MHTHGGCDDFSAPFSATYRPECINTRRKRAEQAKCVRINCGNGAVNAREVLDCAWTGAPIASSTHDHHVGWVARKPGITQYNNHKTARILQKLKLTSAENGWWPV